MKKLHIKLLIGTLLLITLLSFALGENTKAKFEITDKGGILSRGQGEHVYVIDRAVAERLKSESANSQKLNAGLINADLLYTAASSSDLDFANARVYKNKIVDRSGKEYIPSGSGLSVIDSSRGYPVQVLYGMSGEALGVQKASIGSNEVDPRLIQMMNSESGGYLASDLQGAKYDSGTGDLITKDNRRIRLSKESAVYYGSDGKREEKISFSGDTIIVEKPDGTKTTLQSEAGSDGSIRYYSKDENADKSKSGKNKVYDRNMKQVGIREGSGNNLIDYSTTYWPQRVVVNGEEAIIRYSGRPGEVCDPTRNPYCGMSSSSITITADGMVYADYCGGRKGCKTLEECTSPACKGALEAYKTANLGPALSNAYIAAKAGQELFPQIENFEAVDKFFQGSIGKFLTGEPSFGVCEEYNDRSTALESGYLVSDDELFTLLAHVEGQRSIIINPNDSNDTQYFYYVTYQINAAEDLSYNVELMQGDSVIAKLMDSEKSIAQGKTESITGEAAAAFYSRKFYDGLCLRMTVGATCNKFRDVTEAPLIPYIPRADPRVGGPEGIISGQSTNTLSQDYTWLPLKPRG